MMTFSPNAGRFTALMKQALREQALCEHFRMEWGAIDSEAADNCGFDAGTLYACSRILQAAQRGEDLLDATAALIDSIAKLNDERADSKL